MADGRTVPNMESVAISGIPELQAHLQTLVDDPSAPINAKMLDDVELQLTESNIPALLPVLLPPLTTILKTTQQDPSPLLSLSVKLLSPLTFPTSLRIADPPTLITALRSPIAGANKLALAIIHKAAQSPQYTSQLSDLAELVRELVRRWLESEDTGVGENAARALEDLLRTDSPVPAGSEVRPDGVNGINGTEVVRHRREPGQGSLWRLIFTERECATIIRNLCSSETSDESSRPRTNHAVTISQGRLLRILPRLATVNFEAITLPVHPDLFPCSIGNGLLQWAAFDMVDTSDMLMHLSLIDFWEAFVSVMRVAETSHATNEDVVKSMVQYAARSDSRLLESLRSLPDRTVEEEAEPLRTYIDILLGS